MGFRSWWFVAVGSLLVGCPGGDDGATDSGAEGSGTQSTSAPETETTTADGTATSSSSAEGTAETTAGGGSGSCESPTPILQPSGAPSGFERCEDGRAIHVASVTCEETGGPGVCNEPTENGNCTTDADCTDGPFGRCNDTSCGPGGCGCSCRYGCETDADCGAGEICACSGTMFLGRSRCMPAPCVTSADCGDGLCVLGSKEFACMPDNRLACTTPDDTCTLSDDCESFESCYPQGGVWGCLEEDCA